MTTYFRNLLLNRVRALLREMYYDFSCGVVMFVVGKLNEIYNQDSTLRRNISITLLAFVKNLLHRKHAAFLVTTVFAHRR